ncbi:MAG: DUF1385 domain-containing protein [Lachnospiraceae bacterium]|nr:DUF1385 domain-containing protein [Lachnospiraceae bacterium]
MKPSGIGGQAVLEGIMMKNKEKYAVAVRKPDKEIELKVDEYKGITKGNKILNLPFIRGVFNFIDSLILGMKTLIYSADFYEDEDEVEVKPGDKVADSLFKEKAESVMIGVTVFISVIIAIGLFMVLPTIIAGFFEKQFNILSAGLVSAIEGIVRITLFLIYVVLISFMKDIQRTYMYHGAEHKCINCIEHGNELTVENVMKSSRLHRRCGTSFLLFVMIISIILFMFIRVDGMVLKIVTRLLLVPVVAGISYEIIRLAGRSDALIVRIISAPGLLLQRLTTKEPDEDMVEVAIAAVEAVFDWKQYLEEYEAELDAEMEESEESDSEENETSDEFDDENAEDDEDDV